MSDDRKTRNVSLSYSADPEIHRAIEDYGKDNRLDSASEAFRIITVAGLEALRNLPKDAI